MTENSNATVTVTKIAVRDDIDPPKLFNVKYNNDDYTPFEFVISTMIEIFGLPKDTALELTKNVHEQGSAIVKKEYTYEVAEYLVKVTMHNAKLNKYPLLVELVSI